MSSGYPGSAIVGNGIDLVSVERLQRTLLRHPNRFPRKILSELEFSQFVSRGSKVQDLAKYFAVKEAAAKALGTGMGGGVFWPQLELTRKPVSGAPLLAMHGAAAERLQKIGGAAAVVSIADEGDLVIASVVIGAALANNVSNQNSND